MKCTSNSSPFARLKQSFEIFPTGFNACKNLSIIILFCFHFPLSYKFQSFDLAERLVRATALANQEMASARGVLHHRLSHNARYTINSPSPFTVFHFFVLLLFSLFAFLFCLGQRFSTQGTHQDNV